MAASWTAGLPAASRGGPRKECGIAPCSQDGRRPRVTARGRHVANVELERLETSEAPAGKPRHDVQPVALADHLGDVRPTERDPVQDVEVATQRQLGMA